MQMLQIMGQEGKVGLQLLDMAGSVNRLRLIKPNIYVMCVWCWVMNFIYIYNFNNAFYFSSQVITLIHTGDMHFKHIVMIL